MKDSRSAETQAPESSTMSRLSNGFRAHLQGVGLHDLVMLQNLVRASGVFVVLSGERTGTLHFSRGQLLHAETAELHGDAAAIEILSWREGEFINSERTPGEHSSVSASLESLLLRLAKETEEVRPSEPPLTTSTGVRRRMEGAQSLRSTHQGLGVPPAYGGASLAPNGPASAPISNALGQSPTSSAPVAVTLTNVPAAPSGPPPSRRLAAAATPGMAASSAPGAAVPPSTPPAPPSTSAPPAPSSSRGEARVGITNVIVSPRGALVDGSGADVDALGSKVAYIARLTDLIGVAMGAGDTRSVKVRTPASDLIVRRHTDGHVSATLGPADPASDAPPPSSPPPSVKLS